MADISKCAGTNCEHKHRCYRFTAPSSYYQYYSLFYENLNDDGKCDDFWDNTEYEKRKWTETYDDLFSRPNQ